MRQDRLDRWLGPVLCLFATGWLWIVFTTVPASPELPEAGPRAFPLLLGGLLAALGLYLTAAAFFGIGPRSERARPVERATAREGAMVLGSFALFVAYGFLMEKIGFIAATPLFVVAAIRLILGITRWRLNFAIAGGITAGCWGIFIWLLEVPLPRGSWIEVF
jgi:putative tricarboxylic transport membrane protein